MPADRIITGGIAADVDGMEEQYERIGESERQNMRDRFRLSRPVFLYVGRMIKLKGVAELLSGWQIYKEQERGPGSLLLVGEGEQQDSLQVQVKERGLREVHFVGGVDYDTIVPFYAAADVFIIATLEDNWSLVVPEAMACGLPIACSKYNGCWPELVKIDENGIVFDPLDRQDICTTLKFFADHQDSIGRMGQVSRKIVSEFTPQRVAIATLKACEAALHRRRGE